MENLFKKTGKVRLIAQSAISKLILWLSSATYDSFHYLGLQMLENIQNFRWYLPSVPVAIGGCSVSCRFLLKLLKPAIY
jgi:hypothetical protein